MNKVPCIYRILSLATNKFYIGSTNNFRKRVQQHRSHLNKKTHPNIHLQVLANTYGLDDLRYDIVRQCSLEELPNAEQDYLDIFCGTISCLNLAKKTCEKVGVPLELSSPEVEQLTITN
jgi:group I intron endonuclease